MRVAQSKQARTGLLATIELVIVAQIPSFGGEVFPPPSGLSLTLPVSGFWFWFLPGVLPLPSCFASFAELGPLLSPCLLFSCHTCTHQLCALFLFLFCFILFLLFPSISIDVGATTGVFLLFPNGFLLCDHGLDFSDRLM